MHEHKATCKEVMSHICDSLGEDINSPKCIAIKNHLDECDSCKKYFSSVENTIKFYKLYNVEISRDAHKRLFDCLDLPDLEDTE
jgi:hypothetical protein